MTRPSKSSLVLDGNDVKLRLEAERAESGVPVHVDWLRFTTYLRNAPLPHVDRLFPRNNSRQIWHEDWPEKRLAQELADLPDSDFAASSQAHDLAVTVAGLLGADFIVSPDIRKGHDFYKFRWSIERNGAEAGWVGFLASGDSPRQQAQSRTIHVNLFGAACTFARPGWNLRLADLVDQLAADITRADLALDMFDGMPGGMERLEPEWKAGLMDVAGKRPVPNMVGKWPMGQERSFYFGSKEAGKQTNVYEKGDQLFGADAGSPWIRAELRYGNKLRVLPSDLLRRPADFFAGASDWHAALLREVQQECASPEAVPTTPRLALETVAAEVTRNVRWALNTAAPTIAAAFRFLGEEDFLELVTNKKLPGRLRKFSLGELGAAFAGVMTSFAAGGAGPTLASGT